MDDGAGVWAAPDDARRLISALRERLGRCLQELSTCRALLVAHRVPHEAAFSARLEDHDDVLGPPAAVDWDGLARAGDSDSQAAQATRPGAADAGETVDVEASAAGSALSAAVQSAAADLGAAPGWLARPLVEEVLVPSGHSAEASALAPVQATALDAEAREREMLEEELSMAKALLMLNNVSINMDFDQDEGGQASAAQVVNLKGSRHLIQLLITLKQKVSLLKQQYLLLRGDMLYLNHEMNVCRHWVLQSFRAAMQHMSNEHSSLQTRFERLSKVLN